MARLHIVVSPGARRNDLEIQPDGMVQARVTARATDGKANRALIALLAERLQTPKSSISIARGAATRHKVVELAGLSDDVLLTRLTDLERAQ